MLAHPHMWLLHKLLHVENSPSHPLLPPNSPQLAGPGWGNSSTKKESLISLTSVLSGSPGPTTRSAVDQPSRQCCAPALCPPLSVFY